MGDLFISSDHPIKIIRLDAKAEQDREISFKSTKKRTPKEFLQKKSGQSDLKSPQSKSVNTYDEDSATSIGYNII